MGSSVWHRRRAPTVFAMSSALSLAAGLAALLCAVLPSCWPELEHLSQLQVKKKNSLEKFTETCSRFIRKPNVTEPNRKKSPNSFPLFSMNSVFNDWKQSSRFRVKKLYFSIEFDDEKSKLNIQCVSLGIQNHWFHTIVCIAWINCWGKKSDIKCCSNRE